RDQHLLAAHHMRLDLVQVIRPDPGAGIPERFPAGRRDGIGAPPDVDLLLAPFLTGVVLVEAGEVAIVALVQRLVLERLEARLAELIEHDVERPLRPLQGRGEGNAEVEPLGPDAYPGGARLLDALRRQVDIAPAGEEVEEVPFALSVTDDDEGAVHGRA